MFLLDRLKRTGFEEATLAGISISMEDLTIPAEKVNRIKRAKAEVAKVEEQYRNGIITDGERYNKVIDIWTHATDEVSDAIFKGLDSFNPVFMMADSGARGSRQQIRQLAGMRGLMAKPSGEIIETPIIANFREGLNVLQYFTSTHGARKGLADTALKTANSGYLTRRLVDVAQDGIISEFDCGTMDGIEVSSLVEGGEIIEPMGDRILGRVALDDILDPHTDEVIVEANDEITEDLVKKISERPIDIVKIRSVLTCQAKRGVCVECYGRDLSRGQMVNLGEVVGVIAAQSIGEPGTQLTMRTFHIGGTASRRVEQSTLECRNPGIVKFYNMNIVDKADGSKIVLNRNGEVGILDQGGRDRERYQVVYGSTIFVSEGDNIAGGTLIAEWDPFSVPILTEVDGVAKFGDITESITMEEKLDPVTGLSSKVVVDSKDVEARPRISIKEEGSKATRKIPGTTTPARYFMPVGANIVVVEGSNVEAGDVLAKIPRETTKTKDITGGLPRVAELFEARKPKEHAVISEIDGFVSFGKDLKGKRRVIITPDVGTPKEYLISKGKHLTVQEQDRVRAGEPLMDGAANPHDILRVLGEKDLARYLVDEIQEVYRLQGVKINDKHIEVIVRQMLRRIRVKDVGDSNFLVDEQVEKWVFNEENQRVIAEGGQPAVGEALLLGITKASLSTDSFISASSFQETTKVLTEASIKGKVDYLKGLKENVIMGRLIPAGTGRPGYSNLEMEVELPAEVEALSSHIEIAQEIDIETAIIQE